MNNKFYVYAYLDPRKKGNFKYGKYEFEYEPFYIGKGSGERSKQHLQEWSLKVKCFKNNKIKSILKNGDNPIITYLYKNINESDSFLYEMELINIVGRHNNKCGPLTNITDGGEGVSGRIITDEFRLKQSIIMKEYFKENPMPKKTRNKISKILLSKNMTRSKETRDKIGEANRGRVYSEEYLEYMREIRKGPKLTHRNKFILTSPNNEIFEVLGKEDLNMFVKNNELSIRKLNQFINKGVIKDTDVRKVVNGVKNNTINCIGWKINQIN